jgi:hypothetical protein
MITDATGAVVIRHDYFAFGEDTLPMTGDPRRFTGKELDPETAQDVESYIANEQRLGRMLDYAVIVPRLQRLYEWSAEELGEPRLRELVRDGSPTTRGRTKRNVWRARHMPFQPAERTARRCAATRAETCQLLAEFEDANHLRGGSMRVRP